MPIDMDQFRENDGKILEIAEGTNKWRVMQLLVRNPDKAFTRSEIIEMAEINENSVGPVLSRLKERNLVEDKAGYWALADDDRLAAFTAMESSIDAANERLGEENMSEWQKHSAGSTENQ